jgi:molybdopterin-synthase adenylyltransferase
MSRLDRQSFLGASSDRDLSGLRVGIVGLGGGGSHVAQQLAHVGVGKYVLVDPDVIEDSNLNQLVGATAHDVTAAVTKVDIAERLILNVHPAADVQTQCAQWQENLDLLKTCDVIVGGVDSVRAKDELERFCRRFLIPYIDIGMDVHKVDDHFLIAGQVVLSSPGCPCLRCMGIVREADLEAEARNYGAAGGKPQVVWPNGLLASAAVGLLVQMVCPWHAEATETAYLEYDGNQNTLRPSMRLKALAAGCCKHYPPEETGEAGFDIRS